VGPERWGWVLDLVERPERRGGGSTVRGREALPAGGNGAAAVPGGVDDLREDPDDADEEDEDEDRRRRPERPRSVLCSRVLSPEPERLRRSIISSSEMDSGAAPGGVEFPRDDRCPGRFPPAGGMSGPAGQDGGRESLTSMVPLG